MISTRMLAVIAMMAVSAQAQAIPIRVEFETTVITAIDRVTRAVVPVAPISGRFTLEFDDTNAVWDRDEWGPLYTFSAGWVTTPVTSLIPFFPYQEALGSQLPPFSFSQGMGYWGDTGITPFAGYEVGFNDQGFHFYQDFVKVGLGLDGRDTIKYSMQFSLSTIMPAESFKPLSTLEFLRGFVGGNKAPGGAGFQESYTLQRYADGGGLPTIYGGLTYVDRNLKVLSVTDLSAEVPEPGTIVLVLAGAAAGAVRRRLASPVPGNR